MTKRTKRSRRQKETFGEFILRLVESVILVVFFIVLGITLVIIVQGDKKIANLEKEWGVTTTPTVYETERKSVKETVWDYINSLPIPEKEAEETPLSKDLTMVQDVEQETVDEVTMVTFNTSAYCSCEKCCGKTDGITASGKKATAWHTIAAGKSFKMGTTIYIPALANEPNGGWFVVEDRGGAISDDKLDIYLNSHSEALQYGRKNLEAYVYQ